MNLDLCVLDLGRVFVIGGVEGVWIGKCDDVCVESCGVEIFGCVWYCWVIICRGIVLMMILVGMWSFIVINYVKIYYNLY